MSSYVFNSKRKIYPLRRRSFLSLIGIGLASPGLVRAADAPALMLANVYRPGVVLADYWVSEKYDGVRGYWDGQALWTRGGERVVAPGWFTAGWPQTAMDGELWAGHGQFAKAVSTVRQQTLNDAAWRAMRFMVFDLPAQAGTFNERISALNGVVGRIDQRWVQPVAQFKVANHQALQALLLKTVKDGGEGLVLHRALRFTKASAATTCSSSRPTTTARRGWWSICPARANTPERWAPCWSKCRRPRAGPRCASSWERVSATASGSIRRMSARW